jgi:transposase
MATKRSRKTTTRQKFSREYKIEAVRLSADGTKTVAMVAKELGINPNQLYRWRRQLEQGGVTAFPGNGMIASQDEEVHRLRRELKRVTEERDFLKKATAFFAKESR